MSKVQPSDAYILRGAAEVYDRMSRGCLVNAESTEHELADHVGSKLLRENAALFASFAARLRALAVCVEQIMKARDVEVRIYPDGSVGVDNMTTWRRDEELGEAFETLLGTRR